MHGLLALGTCSLPEEMAPRPMRVLHTESSCGWGGQEIRILEESRILRMRGHEVAVACPSSAPLHTRAADWGVPVIACPIGCRGLRALLRLRRILSDWHPDVVNTHSSTDSWLAAIACRTLREPPPIVRTRHISAPIQGGVLARWLYADATRHVVTTGQSVRAQVICASGIEASRITSVPTGVDPDRFCPVDRRSVRRTLGLEPDRPLAGIVATLRSWKGHTDLLEAWAMVRSSDWHLLVVGDGPQRAAIESRVRELGLDGTVRIVGHQDEPEHWFQAIDVCCLPSFANEGVPQALIQAMMSGCAVIATNVGSMSEVIADGETGLVVPPRDARSLAAALARLTESADLRAALSRRARAHVLELFTLERMADRMEHVFASVLRGTMEAPARRARCSA